MKITLKYCSIVDVVQINPKDGSKNNRVVTVQMNEEDFFDMLDSINPKNIVKYLDMRFINHRDSPTINIYQCKNQELPKRNRIKLNRCLKILDAMDKKEKL